MKEKLKKRETYLTDCSILFRVSKLETSYNRRHFTGPWEWLFFGNEITFWAPGTLPDSRRSSGTSTAGDLRDEKTHFRAFGAYVEICCRCQPFRSMQVPQQAACKTCRVPESIGCHRHVEARSSSNIFQILAWFLVSCWCTCYTHDSALNITDTLLPCLIQLQIGFSLSFLTKSHWRSWY